MVQQIPPLFSSTWSRPSHLPCASKSPSFMRTLIFVGNDTGGTRAGRSCQKLRERRKPHNITCDSKYYARCTKCGAFNLSWLQVFGVILGRNRCECWKKPLPRKKRKGGLMIFPASRLCIIIRRSSAWGSITVSHRFELPVKNYVRLNRLSYNRGTRASVCLLGCSPASGLLQPGLRYIIFALAVRVESPISAVRGGIRIKLRQNVNVIRSN